MLIGYRCKVCGAPVDPETGYCKYCDTLNFKPIVDKPLKDDGRPRIIIRDEESEAEIFPQELSLTLEDDPMIEITSLGDVERRYIPAIRHNQHARFSVKTVLTEKQTAILRNQVFDTVFSGFRPGYAHEFKAYVSDFRISMLPRTITYSDFDIVSVNPVDLWNTRRIHNLILEGMRCPICGADLDPEKSKCDYCGYWWIYSPEG